MWLGSIIREYVNRILWSLPSTKRQPSFTIHTFKLTLGNLGGVILPALFTYYIVPLVIIH
jgi:hypothetical protein